MEFSGIVSTRGESVQIFSEGTLKPVAKKRQSNKYSFVKTEIEPGTILKLEEYYSTPFSKKSLNGWYRLSADGKLEEIPAPSVETTTVYLHEIHEEISNPTTYEG